MDISSREIKDPQLREKYEFRSIRKEEGDEAAEIELICFPPNEACTPKMMLDRVEAAPDLFLVAIDKATGKMAGFLNGLSTNETKFRDEFFTDANLYEPDGKYVMLLGLDVLPEYRGQGLAREIMHQYLAREKENGRDVVILTCLDEKVKMYEKFGYVDLGKSDSVWGGEPWHDMSYDLHGEGC